MGGVTKTVFSLVCLVFALTPLWAYLVASHLLAPDGFWQKLILFGVGLWFLGGLQFVLFIGWVALTFVLILDE